jgi:hypothetical protein
LTAELNIKIKEAEAEKESFHKAFSSLKIKEDEIEIKRLQLLRTTKEEDVQKRLKILEQELA